MTGWARCQVEYGFGKVHTSKSYVISAFKYVVEKWEGKKKTPSGEVHSFQISLFQKRVFTQTRRASH